MDEKNVGKVFRASFFERPYCSKSTKTHLDGALLNALLCMYVCLPVCLPIRLSAYLPVCLHL